jgi:hypothetical protein
MGLCDDKKDPEKRSRRGDEVKRHNRIRSNSSQSYDIPSFFYMDYDIPSAYRTCGPIFCRQTISTWIHNNGRCKQWTGMTRKH